MQRIYIDTVTDVSGNVLANADLYVYLAGTSTPATVYSDNGITPVALPLVTDGYGQFTAYAANGRYDIKVTRAGYTDTWYRDILLDDPWGIAGADPTGVADSTAALTAYFSGGGYKLLPPGTYLVTDQVTVPSNVTIDGQGCRATIRSTTLDYGVSGVIQFAGVGVSNVKIMGVRFELGALNPILSSPRCVYFSASSDYEVSGCQFVTPGAAVASVGCSNYAIRDNEVYLQSIDGLAHNDGQIDNWGGAHDLTIADNRIYCAHLTGTHAILVTGQNTDTTAAKCYNVTITGNQVYDATSFGIWVNGRNGTGEQIVITDNIVNGVSLFHGIGVSDCYGFVIDSNIIRDTQGNGIRVYNENVTYGTVAGRYGSVSSNTVVNANLGLTSGGNGAAIAVLNTSDRVVIDDNTVRGTTHDYMLAFSTTGTNLEVGVLLGDAGVTGTVLNYKGKVFSYADIPLKSQKSGLLYAGPAASIAVGSSTHRQVQFAMGQTTEDGGGQFTAGAAFTRWSNDSTGPMIALGHSRGATVGTYTILQNGDALGYLRWSADDGVNMQGIGAQIAAYVDGVPGAGNTPGRIEFGVSPAGAATTTTYAVLYSTGSFRFRNLFGYDAGFGVGGTVTQATSKSTGVTLNKVCGQITMNNASLAAATAVAFTLTNSSITATTDLVLVTISSGATAGAYTVSVGATGAGSCSITLKNETAGPLSEAVVLNFAVIKGATT